MNPFFGMEVGEECLGTITLYRLNPKRLLNAGTIRKGTKSVRIPVGSNYRTVDLETYFYRGPQDFQERSA